MGYGPAMCVAALLCLFLLSPALRAGAPSVLPARPRVLVLEPASKSFDAATTSTIAGLIIVELAKDASLDVISAAEVQRLAELEGDRQAVGCGDESCLAELAGAMGARYVIFGDAGTLGGTVVLNLNLFDSQTTQAVNRVAVKADGVDALPAAVPGPLRELTAPLTGATMVPAPAVTTTSSGAILSSARAPRSPPAPSPPTTSRRRRPTTPSTASTSSGPRPTASSGPASC